MFLRVSVTSETQFWSQDFLKSWKKFLKDFICKPWPWIISDLSLKLFSMHLVIIQSSELMAEILRFSRQFIEIRYFKIFTMVTRNLGAVRLDWDWIIVSLVFIKPCNVCKFTWKDSNTVISHENILMLLVYLYKFENQSFTLL